MLRALLVVAVMACGSPEDPSVAEKPASPPIGAAPAKPPAASFEIAPPSDKIIGLGRDVGHACVVRSSGAVDCWGVYPTCEDCAVTPDPVVHRMAGVTDAIAIDGEARCVLRRGGEVACLDTKTNALVPIVGVAKVRALGTGECFVLEDGGVKCLDEQRKPFAVNVHDAVAVASSSGRTCVVRKSGRLACGWITGDSRELVTSSEVEHVTEVVVGRSYTCVIAAGNAACIDEDADKNRVHVIAKQASQIAAWTEAQAEMPSIEVVVGGKVVAVGMRGGDETNIVAISDATLHVRQCALRAQGSVVCWGKNTGGVLAQPTTVGRLSGPPVRVVGISDVIDIALGTAQTFALTRDGRVFRWGRAQHSHWLAETTPSELRLGVGPTKLRELAAGPHGQLCMRSSDGDVWCQDQYEGRITPVDTAHVAHIVMTWETLYALRTDGRVESHPLRGYGDIELLSERNVVDFADTGGGGACVALRDPHEVRCGTKLAGLDAVTSVVSGDDFGCALQRGRVSCWHRGDGGNTDGPAELTQLRDVIEIAAGRDVACAIEASGRLSCWHFAKAGKPEPPHEVIPKGATHVELGWARADQLAESRTVLDGPDPGGEYGCAIMTDRTVTCWGANLLGELGDGSVSDSGPIGVAL